MCIQPVIIWELGWLKNDGRGFPVRLEGYPRVSSKGPATAILSLPKLFTNKHYFANIFNIFQIWTLILLC